MEDGGIRFIQFESEEARLRYIIAQFKKYDAKRKRHMAHLQNLNDRYRDRIKELEKLTEHQHEEIDTLIAEYDDASRFEEITRRMAETYRIKSHDYGNSYGDSIRELGLIAGFVPILHKCNRMKNLVQGVEPQVAESLRDTVMDMANYLILFAMELDKMDGK